MVRLLFEVALVVSSVHATPIPFGKTAVHIASLDALKKCEKAPWDRETKKCENTHEALNAWRYALNNAMEQLIAVDGPVKHAVTVTQLLSSLKQISDDSDDDDDGRRAAKRYKILMPKLRQAFEGELREWLLQQLPVEVNESHSFIRAGRAALEAFGSIPELSGKGLKDATVALSEGVNMPLVGFGTWQLEGPKCTEAVKAALEAGIRHIDTAQSYENEKEVGVALSLTALPREELFLVTKLSEEKDFTTKGAVKRLRKQLKLLNTSYVDVYMLHGPSETSRKRTLAAWRGLEEIMKLGLTRAIGVSNFEEEELKWLIKKAVSKPTYIQNKFSPYYHGGEAFAQEFPSFLRENGIHLVGYSVINPWPGIVSPLADPNVLAVAGKHTATAAQVLHRWALQLGVAVIPKSGSRDRIEENSKLFDFELSKSDMELISGLARLAHQGESTSTQDTKVGAKQEL